MNSLAIFLSRYTYHVLDNYLWTSTGPADLRVVPHNMIWVYFHVIITYTKLERYNQDCAVVLN